MHDWLEVNINAMLLVQYALSKYFCNLYVPINARWDRNILCNSSVYQSSLEDNLRLVKQCSVFRISSSTFQLPTKETDPQIAVDSSRKEFGVFLFLFVKWESLIGFLKGPIAEEPGMIPTQYGQIPSMASQPNISAEVHKNECILLIEQELQSSQLQ